MATTQITETAFQTALAECADAIALGNWDTARTKHAIAEAINAGMPVESRHAEASMRRRESLSSLGKAIESAQSALTASSDRRRFITTSVGFGNSK